MYEPSSFQNVWLRWNNKNVADRALSATWISVLTNVKFNKKLCEKEKYPTLFQLEELSRDIGYSFF